MTDGELEFDVEEELEGEDGVGGIHEDPDTEEEEGAAAGAFFRAQRTSRRKKQKRSLSSLPGGEAKELADQAKKSIE